MKDLELPNGFQDADFEQNALERLGARSAKLRKQGICSHGWLFAPEHGEAKCLHCNKVFPDSETARDEGRRILNGDY